MEWLQRIDDDLFGIAWRLKEVDDKYELYRNLKSRRFEVRAKGVLQFAVPFAELDARTVEHARKTRVERQRALLDEIERENAAAERRARSAAIERTIASVQI